jgi:hypothetical protein
VEHHWRSRLRTLLYPDFLSVTALLAQSDVNCSSAPTLVFEYWHGFKDRC